MIKSRDLKIIKKSLKWKEWAGSTVVGIGL